MIEILGERCGELDGTNAVLWHGDLLLFDDSHGRNRKAHMVYVPNNRGGLGHRERGF